MANDANEGKGKEGWRVVEGVDKTQARLMVCFHWLEMRALAAAEKGALCACICVCKAERVRDWVGIR